MSLASPIWKAMFDRQRWAESTATEISFPDDDIDTLLIVLQIAHLRFQDLPGKNALTFRGLLDLAVVCDKYDLVNLVRPFLDLHCWAVDHFPDVEAKARCRPTWLFVAWTFGYAESFEALARHWVLNMELGEDGEPTVATDLLPPGLLESILGIRRATFIAIIKAAHDIINKILTGYECTVNHIHNSAIVKAECRLIIFGSYMEWLIDANMYPLNPTEDEMAVSVQNLREHVNALTIHSFEAIRGMHRISHRSCANVVDLKTKVDNIIFEMPSATLDSHQRHMEEQAKK